MSTIRAAERPTVLFVGGVHAGYVTQPLHAMGVELDTCAPGELAARLATKRYHVVVVHTLDAAQLAALDDFLAAGGGVFVCAPKNYPDEKTWTATCEWLAAKGARPRWEMLHDADAANVVRDVMGSPLSYSEDVNASVKEGVRGVLTLLARSTTGWEPPMAYDLSADWRVLVRGAASMATAIDPRNDVHLQPWIPKEVIASAPPLLAVRQVGPGRLAVSSFRYYWVFASPPNCPTTEAMLTRGAGDKPSDWLRVFANTFAYLAEPTLAAGWQGAPTPDAILHPVPEPWAKQPVYDWAAHTQNWQAQPQNAGLIGARTALSTGQGSVADYVREAKAAGLAFIVFLEDAFAMDQAKWDELVQQCKAASAADFLAVPGLIYEDAQGNHLFAFADQVAFPKPAMLLPDGRLATTQGMRSRAYFDYVNELMSQKVVTGFWKHDRNFLPPVDYKLYNGFPIKSFLNGEPVDDALADFLYLQGIGGGQGALAFELMTSPAQVAPRARDGWQVVAHRPLDQLDGNWHRGVFSFSGSGSQYITNGPRILVWQAPNRLSDPRGEWWRPDLWQWRIAVRVASDAGLKSVTIHDGDKGILRRWLPGGAKEFQHEIVLACSQQLAPTLVVEDVNGRQAISMSYWSRNLVKEEFICTDRCNFLGNSRLRTRNDGQTWTSVGFHGNMGVTPSKGLFNFPLSPALSLTPNAPTLPIDGAPHGFPTAALTFRVALPGEALYLFSYPQTYLVSPEIGIGQADLKFAYDPAEEKAETSPLGHAYAQPQAGWGNSWGSWHRLVPTRKTEGWYRTYAGNWIPGEMRHGWVEMRLTVKERVELAPGKPLTVGSIGSTGWRLWQQGTLLDAEARALPFQPGTLALLEHPGGSVILIPMDGPLTLVADAKGSIRLDYAPDRTIYEPGDAIAFRVAFAGASGGSDVNRLLAFASSLGVAVPGKAGYQPTFRRGKPLSNYLTWRVQAVDGVVDAVLPQAKLDSALLAQIEGLNDRWSVVLLDRNRPWPNHRDLPIRDGTAWTHLDLLPGDLDLFLGHPVIADNPELRLAVSWMAPGVWFVEAHNPTALPQKASLQAAPGWPLFDFAETLALPPGASRTWQVKAKE